MSYARWSNSCWYAFYNVNGKLSLWYDMDHIIDISYEEISDMLKQEEKIPEFLIGVYGCTEAEAHEAITYMKYFAEEYDPKVCEEYQKEYGDLIKRLKDMRDE